MAVAYNREVMRRLLTEAAQEWQPVNTDLPSPFTADSHKTCPSCSSLAKGVRNMRTSYHSGVRVETLCSSDWHNDDAVPEKPAMRQIHPEVALETVSLLKSDYDDLKRLAVIAETMMYQLEAIERKEHELSVELGKQRVLTARLEREYERWKNEEPVTPTPITADPDPF